MHLQQQPALQTFTKDVIMYAHHRELDDVGRCSLHGRVDRYEFRRRTHRLVAAVDVRQVSPALHHGLYIAMRSSEAYLCFHVPPHPGELLEISIDDELCFRSRYAQCLAEAESALAVCDAEIHGLGPA